MRVALLSGEHERLPSAELEALLAVHAPGIRARIDGRVAWIDDDAPAVDEALARAMYVGEWGVFWGDADDSPDGIRHLAARARHAAHGDGSAAVRTTRFGRNKSRSHEELARTVGSELVAAGHRIDLDAPSFEVFAWLGAGQIIVGERRGGRDAGVHARRMEARAHFSPIGLHPRLAGALIHLARVPPGGRVYDPFCGTGGIVLEAALDGHEAWGSDLDPWMVQGTCQTLTDVAEEPLDGTVFHADIGDAPALVEGIEGIVTDLPYGGASSTHDEALDALYARAFAAFAKMLAPGAHAVIGCPDAELLRPIEAHGFERVAAFEDFVHKSLTRHFVVVKRTA